MLEITDCSEQEPAPGLCSSLLAYSGKHAVLRCAVYLGMAQILQEVIILTRTNNCVLMQLVNPVLNVNLRINLIEPPTLVQLSLTYEVKNPFMLLNGFNCLHIALFDCVCSQLVS